MEIQELVTSTADKLAYCGTLPDDMREEMRSESQLHEYRSTLAKSLGLEPIGKKSYFSSLVAVHPEAPEFVIKLSEMPDDGFVVYALYCLHNPADDLLKVHSVTPVGNAFLIVCERLEAALNERDRCAYVAQEQRELKSEHLLQSNVKYWINKIGFTIEKLSKDCHDGNAMERADGTIVWSDPFSGCRLSRGGENQTFHDFYTAIQNKYAARIIAPDGTVIRAIN